MIFKIEVVTRDSVTIEADGIGEAQWLADGIVANYNKHNHHGEVTTATVVRDEVEVVDWVEDGGEDE